eukprot:15469009-Alexandrium_andersonii.AAC.1
MPPQGKLDGCRHPLRPAAQAGLISRRSAILVPSGSESTSTHSSHDLRRTAVVLKRKVFHQTSRTLGH